MKEDIYKWLKEGGKRKYISNWKKYNNVNKTEKQIDYVWTIEENGERRNIWIINEKWTKNYLNNWKNTSMNKKQRNKWITSAWSTAERNEAVNT